MSRRSWLSPVGTAVARRSSVHTWSKVFSMRPSPAPRSPQFRRLRFDAQYSGRLTTIRCADSMVRENGLEFNGVLWHSFPRECGRAGKPSTR